MNCVYNYQLLVVIDETVAPDFNFFTEILIDEDK